MNRLLKICAGVFVLMCVSGIAFGQGWHIEPVAVPHHFLDMSPDCSALDSQGYPAVAYGGDGMFFVRFDGTRWVYETIDDEIMVGRGACLRFDASDQAHVVYAVKNTMTGLSTLRYATQAGDSWQISDVPETDFNALVFSMALDSSGNPWIIHYNQETDTVEMVTESGTGGWNSDTLFLSMMPVTCINLEMLGDRPYFGYIADSQLRLGYHNGSSYETVGVEAETVFHNNMDMEMESNGFAHFCYSDLNQSELRYSTFDPEGWPAIPEVVESSGITNGRYVSLSLDPVTEQPVIFYLKHDTDFEARLAFDTGPNWQFRNMETSGSYFQFMSVNIDLNSDIHCVYYRYDNSELRYGSFISNHIETMKLDDNVQYGPPVCTAMNSAGDQSIIYRNQNADKFLMSVPYSHGRRSSNIPDIGDGAQMVSYDVSPGGDKGVVWTSMTPYMLTTGYLTLTRTTSSGWVSETVDTDPVSFNQISYLQFDSFENPHILYMTPDPELRYATCKNGTWERHQVFADTVTDYSLVVTDNADVFVTFLDSANNVYFAELNGTQWDLLKMYSASSSVRPMIKLDEAQRPHIMIMDPDVNQFGHYWRDQSQWKSEAITVIDCLPGMGFDFVAGSTRPTCILWWDSIQDSLLKLAIQTEPSGSWQIEKIDDDVVTAFSLSLTMDPMNRMSVTYFDAMANRIYCAQHREPVWYDLGMPDTLMEAGDDFKLERRWYNTTAGYVKADEYALLDVYGEFWFAPDWTREAHAMVTGTDAESIDYEVIFDFTWPDVSGSASEIRFWGGLVEHETSNLLDYDMVTFGWQ